MQFIANNVRQIEINCLGQQFPNSLRPAVELEWKNFEVSRVVRRSLPKFSELVYLFLLAVAVMRAQKVVQRIHYREAGDRADTAEDYATGECS